MNILYEFSSSYFLSIWRNQRNPVRLKFVKFRCVYWNDGSFSWHNQGAIERRQTLEFGKLVCMYSDICSAITWQILTLTSGRAKARAAQFCVTFFALRQGEIAVKLLPTPGDPVLTWLSHISHLRLGYFVKNSMFIAQWTYVHDSIIIYFGWSGSSIWNSYQLRVDNNLCRKHLQKEA